MQKMHKNSEVELPWVHVFFFFCNTTKYNKFHLKQVMQFWWNGVLDTTYLSFSRKSD